MATILTKYYPATNFKGSRIKVWKPNGLKAKFYSYPHEARDAHAWAALKYAEEVLGWKGEFIQGEVDANTQCHVLRFPLGRVIANAFNAADLSYIQKLVQCELDLFDEESIPEDLRVLRDKVEGMLK